MSTTVVIKPEDVYALVVGVETYDIDEAYNLNGPARDGLKFIEWLLSKDVPAENIGFFVSPLPQNKSVLSSADQQNIAHAPATRTSVEDYINGKLIADGVGGELLYIFWGGHGIVNTIDRTERQLLFSDFTAVTGRSLVIETLIEALRITRDGLFERQIFLIDACANPVYNLGSSEAIQSANSALRITSNGDFYSTKEQYVLFAADIDNTTANDSVEGTGIFSQLMLRELSKQESLWPDLDNIYRLLSADNRLTPASLIYKRPGTELLTDRRYSVANGDLPLPNAGHSQKPKSQPAFFLNPSNTRQGNPLQNVEFNLELFLGLERKAFTAIIAGFEGDGLLDSFRSIEYELQAAVESNPDYNKLSTRWWVRLEINEWTALPRQEADVWAQLIDEDDLSDYLTQKGLPEAVIPGIFLSLEIQALGPALLQNLRDWVSAVINTVFSSLSVAIVIDLQCHSGFSVAEISQHAEQIENSLATSQKISAGAVVRIMLAETCDRLQQSHGLLRSTCPGPSTMDAEGFCIYSWIINALETTQTDFRTALSSYTEILHIYEQFSRYVVESGSISISLRQLINDLDAYASLLTGTENRSLNLYRHLLEFTQQYKSSSLHELLAAYAYSQSTEAYRQALSFACSHSAVYSDILIDVFLDGINDSSAQITFAQSFDSNNNSWLEPTKEYFVDRLGLAFLRRIDDDRDFQALAEKIQPRLSSKVGLIASFRLGKCSKQELMNRMDRDTQLLTYLISSATKADPMIDFLHSSQYRRKEPYMWALSICLQKYTECFETMLKADKAFSTLWGLCAEELPDFDKEERENFLKHWRNYLAS